MKKNRSKNNNTSKPRFIYKIYLASIFISMGVVLSTILIILYPEDTVPPTFFILLIFFLMFIMPIISLLPIKFSSNLVNKMFDKNFENDTNELHFPKTKSDNSNYTLDSINKDEFPVRNLAYNLGDSLENSHSSIAADDPLLTEVLHFVIDSRRVSLSMIQKKFGIGFNRSARLLDFMEEIGAIGPIRGSKPRAVIWDELDLINYNQLIEVQLAYDYSFNNLYSNNFTEEELTAISVDENIMNEDESLDAVIEYVFNLESFDTNIFQNAFNFDFIKTSKYLDTLKALKLIDSSYKKINTFNDTNEINSLIGFSIMNNEDIITERKLDSLADGYEFESFIAKLLKQNGYDDAKVTQGSNDYGVDVLAEKDGINYAIQCKYYSSTVGNSAVQEIVSGKTHHNAHVGVVATNNYFTQQAKNLAETNNIVLWDRDYLLKLIK